MFDVNAMFKLSHGLFMLTAKEGEECNVSHVPALVHYAPFQSGGRIFKNFFAEVK